MSLRRLAGTLLAMAGTGAGLAVLAPHPLAATRALAAAQGLSDGAGPDAVVLQVVGVLAWVVWAWGALGLALTAASSLPGMFGLLARGVLRLVLPAGARRAAALALGAGMTLTSPALAGTALAGAPAPPVTQSSGAPPVPDWPTAPGPTVGSPVPERQQAGAAATGPHAVVRGECLWRIAEAALPEGSRTDSVIDRSVRAWWTANRGVIGPDPDLLLPGQVLQPPVSADPIPGARP